jgi:hypothetical protein
VEGKLVQLVFVRLEVLAGDEDDGFLLVREVTKRLKRSGHPK